MRIASKNDREANALRALFRKRTASLLRITVVTLAIFELIIVSVNTQTLSKRYSDPGLIQFILSYQITQGLTAVLLAFVGFVFKRVFLKLAIPVIALYGFFLVVLQSYVFLHRADHPRTELMVMLVVLPIFMHMSRARTILYSAFLFAVVSLIVSQKFGVNDFIFPVLIAPTFLGIMGVVFRDMLARQTIAIGVRNRELSRSLTQVKHLKKDQDLIFDTIHDGLFIVRKDLTIGPQYSTALREFFDFARFSGQAAQNFVQHFFPEKSDTISSYLKLLFKKTVTDKNLESLNPLISANVLAGSIRRMFRFDFRRIRSGEEISAVLVRVTDNTKEAMLDEKLRAEETLARDRRNLILAVLAAQPHVLKSFLHDVNIDLADINKALQKNTGDSVREIRQKLHAIKGNAGTLDLAAIVEIVHRAEDEMDLLLLGNRVQEVVTAFTDLNATVAALENYAGKKAQRVENQDFDLSRIKNLLASLAKEKGKPVILSTKLFSAKNLAQKYHKLVSDALVQFVRNTFAHGWQSGSERVAAGKSENMSITLSSKIYHNVLEICYEDDGAGIDFLKLSALARVQGRVIPENPLDLVFESNLTTKSVADELSGRGIGLDLVREEVKRVGGIIVVESIPNAYTRFTIRFSDYH